MVDEKKLANAQRVYQTLCSAIERRNWSFERDDEKLIVNFGVQGDDLPMHFILAVDAGSQMLYLSSPLPFNMCESKRLEGAIVTCVATYGLNDGCFDYDITDGSISFRMTAYFMESRVGEDLLQYMISCAGATVDHYNDRFLAVDKGFLSVSDFIAKEG